MNKRICFFDVDGTLTDEHGGAEVFVPKSTRTALQQAKDAGVLLFANTGRPFGTVHPQIRSLPLTGFICACGTNILMGTHELFRYEIDKKERQTIMRQVNEHQISCVYEAKEGFAYVDEKHHQGMQKIVNTYIKDGYHVLDVNDDLVFEKFCFFKEEDEIWPDLSFLEDYSQIWHSDHFVEIVPKPCSKGSAIQFLLRELGIDEEDCYGFGDSKNDEEMLKITHHSIVMGSASDEVKQLATYVTDAASQDGLAKALAHLGLIEKEVL